MSHSNSHLRAKRGRPVEDLPQAIRPITPPRNSSSEPSLITKSPHPNRTIKKGKLGGDNQHLVPPPMAHSPTPSEIQTQNPSSKLYRNPLTLDPSDAAYAAQTLKSINALLATVLRTVNTLTDNHDIALLDTSVPNKVCTKLMNA